MKKQFLTFLIVISFICMFSLVSCSSQYPNVNAVMDSVKSLSDVNDCVVVSDVAELNRYYLINQSDVADFAAIVSDSTSNYTEIVIIEAMDEESAKNIAVKLNNHYDSLLSQSKSYDVKTADMVSKCSVRRNGIFVDMVISDNAQQITDCIDAFF